MSENLTKARIAKLKKKADAMGITYPDDATEDTLKGLIAEHEPATPPTPPAPAPAPFDPKSFGQVLGHEVGKAIREAKNPTPYEDIREADIDPNDLVEPVTYWVPMLFWIAPAKKHAGQRVMAPIGKVVFELDRGSSVQVGTQFQTRYTASYTTNNRKQQEWLESHHLFNRVFYKSSTDIESVSSRDVRFAMCFGKHMDALNYTMAAELYRWAAELGVQLNHGDSLAVHRSTLANALATRDIMQQEEQEDNIRKEGARLNLLAKMQS